jgi:hypothetical protein
VSAVTIRAAAAATYWARPQRRDDGAILGSVRGLGEQDRGDVLKLLEIDFFGGWPDGDLMGLMLDLAAAKAAPGVA